MMRNTSVYKSCKFVTYKIINEQPGEMSYM